ncbi:hypothetical protein OGATHE_005013 [Ogataea polymorpha]|uniref:Uncharacterized protein n=1 Tax=Ogataea polymorpha TaxID=460523 RepID=A0A9P8T0J6_9ASCO|nr:hypothetical protein OGATHE_005013 [Ogataea polymorpha]
MISGGSVSEVALSFEATESTLLSLVILVVPVVPVDSIDEILCEGASNLAMDLELAISARFDIEGGSDTIPPASAECSSSRLVTLINFSADMYPGIDKPRVSSDPGLLCQDEIELLFEEIDDFRSTHLVVDVVTKAWRVNDRQQQLGVVLVQDLNRRLCDGNSRLLVRHFRIKDSLVLGGVRNHSAEVGKRNGLADRLLSGRLVVLVPVRKNVSVEKRVHK